MQADVIVVVLSLQLLLLKMMMRRKAYRRGPKGAGGLRGGEDL